MDPAVTQPSGTSGRVCLVTGSSRGIGAATARLLAADGAAVVINCRDKVRRAEQLVSEIVDAGGQAMAIPADLTDQAAVQAMFAQIASTYGHLDVLVLNASGGLEADMPPDYALRLNRDAQIACLDAAQALMRPGARVVFVTSHQAHFVHTRPTMAQYEPVARSKRAGEDALRERIPELSRHGIDLVVVSGDMVEGTITATLLDRAAPGAIEERRRHGGGLPGVAEFAAEVVAAVDVSAPSGHTVFVGGDDYARAGEGA